MSDIIVPSGWGSRFEGLIGSKRQTVAMAGAIGVAVVIGVAALGGRAPARVAPPAMGPPIVATPAPSATVAVPLFVHVSGAVRAPGLYRLPSGARVADAIEMAGGPVAKADLDALNLAELVSDGAKVHVPEVGEAASALAPVPGSSASPALVNVNTADAVGLESIPGIGPTRAAAIIAHREQAGPFATVDQLLEIQGIGPATLEALRAYVTV